MPRHDIKHSRLCRYCTQIPLNTDQLKQTPKKSRWDLGTVGRVQQSECKLCRFISFLLYEDTRTRGHDFTDSDLELILEWTGDGGFMLDSKSSYIPWGMRIYYLRNSDTDFHVDRVFSLTSNVGRTVDFERIRGWIDICRDKHVGHCTRLARKAHYNKPIQDSYPKLELLRFIDVQDQCVVETKVARPYAALSYVWGLADTLHLTTYNKADLTQPDALRRYGMFIPKTIRDAAVLVEKIGQRYLWCDALCLIQNDPDDVERGVDTMDLVYENAELTIVAACGHDAKAGLPGVREGTRLQPTYSKEIIPGVRLGGYIALDQRMAHSVYSSRAWT